MPSPRRMIPLLATAALAGLAAWPTPLPAGAAEPMAAEHRAAAPLTALAVESFIATIPAVRLWTDQHAETARAVAPELLTPAALNGNIFHAAVRLIEGTPAHDDLTLAVRRHGFGTADAWAEVANRVTRALGVLAAGRDDAGSPLSEATRAIDDNARLTDAERIRLKGLLMALTLFADAPQADVAAVSPYSGAIVEALRRPL